jgi:hypothetical protein
VKIAAPWELHILRVLRGSDRSTWQFDDSPGVAEKQRESEA